MTLPIGFLEPRNSCRDATLSFDVGKGRFQGDVEASVSGTWGSGWVICLWGALVGEDLHMVDGYAYH